MSQHESWHWTYETGVAQAEGMTATQIRPAGRLSPLVAGIRTAVDSHADWTETAQLVADQLRRHLPTPDVLTAAQRLGSPDGYRSHTLHVEPTVRSRSSPWSGGPQITRIHDHVTWCVLGVSRVSSTRALDPIEPDRQSDNHVGDVSASRLRRHPPRGNTPMRRIRSCLRNDVTRIGSSARRYYD